jgi:hypothetical protein
MLRHSLFMNTSITWSLSYSARTAKFQSSIYPRLPPHPLSQRMAEILGTVASVLQMAGLVTKSVTAGFKFHALYRETQGASASIAASLDDIDIMAQMLDELGNSTLAAHLVFKTALARCKKCLQELQSTLRALDDKIRSSRGFSFRFACLNFILRKADIAKMEHRLKTSLELLLFAIPLAMLASRERLEWVSRKEEKEKKRKTIHHGPPLSQPILCFVKLADYEEQTSDRAPNLPTTHAARFYRHTILYFPGRTLLGSFWPTEPHIPVAECYYY